MLEHAPGAGPRMARVFEVYPLLSPQSLIAEGTANYGIDIAFPVGGGRPSSATRCFRSRDWTRPWPSATRAARQVVERPELRRE